MAGPNIPLSGSGSPSQGSQAQASEVKDAEAQAERSRFQAVFSAVDRILNPDMSNVELTYAPGQAPGWTDGKVVYLNQAALPALKQGADYELELATWLGMNAHELGHTMYTPRQNSRLAKLIDKSVALHGQDLVIVEALVEDQRQERLMVGTFSPLRVYLAAAVANAIAQTPAANVANIWPFVAGRTWLPIELRTQLREMYDNQPARNPKKNRNGKRIAHLIGEYQRYGDPGLGDADEAYRTVVKLYEALMEDGYPLPELPQVCNSHRPNKGEGEYKEIEEGEDGGVDSAGSEGDERNLGKGGTGEGEDESDTSPQDGQDEGEGDDEGSGSEGKGYDPEKGTNDRESKDHQAKGGKGAGNKAKGAKPRELDHTRLKTELRTSVKADVMGDVEINRDLHSMAKALSLTAEGQITLPPIAPHYQDARTDLVILQRQLADQFRRFTDRALPYWERRTETGRFKVARYLNSGGLNYDTMFDRFDPGMQDDLSLDVTLLVDRSGSMGGHLMSQACEAAWVIHRAVQDAGGDTTVIFFDDRSNVMIQPGVKATMQVPYVHAGGNTDPTDGFVAAYRRLVGVEAAHKLVIAVTDGGWSRGRDAFIDIGRLPHTTTVAVLLNGNTSAYGEDWGRNLGGHIHRVMASPQGLLGLTSEVVTLRMAQVMDGYDGA